MAKAKGVDIRAAGSGNIGATNAMRVLGKPAGIFVLLLDALKGYAACAFIAPFIHDWLRHSLFGCILNHFHNSNPIENSIIPRYFPWWREYLPCWATITPAG